MLCEHSIVVKDRFGYCLRVPCGQCLACKLNKVRQLCGRAILELKGSKNGYFITLTFSETNNKGYLQKKDLQDFFKRLRRRLCFRYIACGEYGSKGHRPHYHAIIFTQDSIDYIKFTEFVQSCWTDGFVQVGFATDESIRYVAGYVLKKESLSKEIDEFRLCSRRPGIGVPEWVHMCKDTVDSWKKNLRTGTLTMPSIISLSKEYPVDRHLQAIWQEISGQKKSTLGQICQDLKQRPEIDPVLREMKRTELGKRVAYRHKQKLINIKEKL